MSNHRDEIDSWLDADVQPLTPPPGTFERVSRRARRRKAGRAIASAAGAMVVVAGLAIVPRLAGTLLHQPASRSLGGAVASGLPVPVAFRPTSVTFIGTQTGAVIGQAGRPGSCGPPVAADCTSLAGTSDYGQTWYGVSAPITGGPAGSAGVSGLRFLDARTGWAFGPELWVTHDGGARWAQESTYGLRVTSLETAGDRAFAVFASCAGNSADFAAQCASFRIFSSRAVSHTWQRVQAPAGELNAAGNAAGRAASPSLVLTAGPVADPAAGTGYLLAPSGAVLSGPLNGAPWTVA